MLGTARLLGQTLGAALVALLFGQVAVGAETWALYLASASALLGAGVSVAIATDCNPGSCFTSSMAFCIALAVREMRMTTQEAVWAATGGGARALRRADVGHLGGGARADLVLRDGPSHAYLAYRPGVPLVRAVWRAGRERGDD